MPNVFEQEQEEPPAKYENLDRIISFQNFDHDQYRYGEEHILKPQLEELGYTDIQFKMGESDSWGPLTRLCSARDSSGTKRWFFYG
jgi:hypothetical protein